MKKKRACCFRSSLNVVIALLEPPFRIGRVALEVLARRRHPPQPDVSRRGGDAHGRVQRLGRLQRRHVAVDLVRLGDDGGRQIRGVDRDRRERVVLLVRVVVDSGRVAEVGLVR